ncbi:MAG: hypothetical protein J6Z43_03670 [Clostridiales bacterium]|nr:hypothetical protein [Clostridiales bacterium]
MKRQALCVAALACSAGMILSGCGKAVEETNITTSGSEETTEAYHGPVLDLSGDPDDIINVRENSYYEGERFFIFAAKDSVIRGDLAVNIERVMDELESLYGLSFDAGQGLTEIDWRDEYFGGEFRDINSDLAKPSIVIRPDPDDGTVPWCFSNVVMLYDTDLASEHSSFDTLYHEMAHLLRFRQSGNLGKVMEEGIALYAQDQVSRAESFADWSIIQYVDYEGYSSIYDDSALLADPEGEFINATLSPGSAEQSAYQYGIRFVAFLMEAYGHDVIRTISENAAARDLDLDGTDTDTIIEVIKESTSDDVFERFGAWVPEGWNLYCAEYVEYIESFENR